MRSILLHVEDAASLDARMQTALSLARATNGHLTCLHAMPIEAYVAFDGFGGLFVMDKVIEALDEQKASVQARVEERLRREDVNWDYRHATGPVPHALLAYAALADVIVTGRFRGGADADRAALGQLGDIVMKSRIPVLIPGGERANFDPVGKAVIAWNASYEAATAVRASLPLLKFAASVEVVRIGEPQRQENELFPSTRLLEYLSRHDIHAELKEESAEHGFVAEALVGMAVDSGASHIVLGGYGHSRIGEYIFGGVTRTMLESSPVTLVMAH